MPKTLSRSRSRVVKEDPPPEVIRRFERDLETVTRRSGKAHEAADAADVERDRVIRDAHAAGLGPARISQKTGLSEARIAQICRSKRP